MTVLAPPQSREELEALIREARARQRRRRLLVAAVIAIAAAVGLAAWAPIPGRSSLGTAQVGGRPAIGQLDGSTSGSTARLRWVGSSGGVTWAANDGHLWLSAGGSKWLSAPLPRAAMTGEVQFVDRSHGWVSTNTNHGLKIERTTDGGRTWQASHPRGCKACAFGELSFFDAKKGYVFAWASTVAYASPNAGTKLFSTRDGGATWELVSKLRFEYPAEARFVDSRHGVAVRWDAEMGSGHYRVIRTSDGGRTWTPVMLEGKRVYPGWFGVPTISSVGGTLVIPAERFRSRTSPGQPVVYTSKDGGARWQAHAAPPKVFFGYGLFSAASPATWVASDAHGLHFFVTTDGGKKWRKVKTPGGKGAFFGVRWIHFESALAGWAILEDEELVRTTDGGLHWALAGPPKPRH